ncbi:uncharacterized protein LOC142224466 [Haematobia irritans]|uniref:uncharacterized protein LOC142224466 n=1 Tax=Haematobia irritans TaxID=7368 RepID=UPI003F4F53B2
MSPRLYQVEVIKFIVVWILFFVKLQIANGLNFHLESSISDYTNHFGKMLENMHKERSIETIVIVQQNQSVDRRLAGIYQYPMVKMSLEPGLEFYYKGQFNMEILMVIVMNDIEDFKLMDTAAKILTYIRQTRIMIVFLDSPHMGYDNVMAMLLELCYKYKTTNVLLNFMDDSEDFLHGYYQLKPYPQYHWHRVVYDPNSIREHKYYPEHWRNMHRGEILTYPDQTPPRSLAYQDDQGNLKFNGFMARLVMLFAEKFNATLKMYKPVKIGESVYYDTLSEWVIEKKIDLAMSVHLGCLDRSSYIYGTNIVIMGKGMLIVPCAQPLTTKEVFTLLINWKFLGAVAVCTVFFSATTSLIDHHFEGVRLILSNLLLSDRVLPSVLGQSSVDYNSSWFTLKLLYFILFFIGLSISTQFSANMNTLFTQPPSHRQIKTLADIEASSLKINFFTGSMKFLEGFLAPISTSIQLTNDYTLVQEWRNNFNISTGHCVTSEEWHILSLKQQHFSKKVCCTYDTLILMNYLHWNMILQEDSQYQEPLNYIINYVNDFGYIDAWLRNTLTDMYKLKMMSLRYPNVDEDVKAMTLSDFHWVWMFIVIGLSTSCLIFIAELWYYERTKYDEEDRRYAYQDQSMLKTYISSQLLVRLQKVLALERLRFEKDNNDIKIPNKYIYSWVVSNRSKVTFIFTIRS